MTNLAKLFLTLATITGIGVGVGVHNSSTTSLPEKRPAELVITSSVSTGGMSADPLYSTISISEKESSAQTRRGASPVEVKKFTVTPAELDALYEVFRKNSFDKITEHKVEIYDAGSTGVSLMWGMSATANAKTVYKGDDGSGFVDDMWRDSYNNVQAAINALVAKKLK